MKKKSSLKHTGAFWAFCAPCCILFGITDLFNSQDKIASNGIGMALTVTKVFKTIFVLEIRLGSIISHAAMIEAAAISDHDKLSEVK